MKVLRAAGCLAVLRRPPRPRARRGELPVGEVLWQRLGDAMEVAGGAERPRRAEVVASRRVRSGHTRKLASGAGRGRAGRFVTTATRRAPRRPPPRRPAGD